MYLYVTYLPCISAAVAADVVLVLAAAAHRVPDGKICYCGPLHHIPVLSLVFTQTRFIFYVLLYPLAVP